MFVYTIESMINFLEEKFSTSDLYFGHGSVSAFEEAVLLVSSVLEVEPFELFSRSENSLSNEVTDKIMDRMDLRVKTHQPLPYLIGFTYYFGFKFFVNNNVLIPRSPIGSLLTNCESDWMPKETSLVLDLCSGSGCIGILFALLYPQVAVHLSDISDEALKVAKININEHGLSDQIQSFQSDLFHSLPHHKYDIIFANPPYVPWDDQSYLPKEFDFEPAIALFANDDGWALVKRIIELASYWLSDEGVLVLDLGAYAKDIEKIFPTLSFDWCLLNEGEEGVCLVSSTILKSL